MFTGIIETIGTITAIDNTDGNLHFTIESNISNELKIDQSVAHNGVCLTVVACKNNSHTVTAVAETLSKTNLMNWQIGDKINLERAMILGGRLDGHLVQGHVDTMAICTQKKMLEGSALFTFSFPEKFAALVIEKGSICINGVSLTVFDVGHNTFSVTIIPYTLAHTTMGVLEATTSVNIEFDILGKYILRKLNVEQA